MAEDYHSLNSFMQKGEAVGRNNLLDSSEMLIPEAPLPHAEEKTLLFLTVEMKQVTSSLFIKVLYT